MNGLRRVAGRKSLADSHFDTSVRTGQPANAS